jgi:CDP-4-dehydro-6-deoxyglucose reductase, E1
MSSENLHWPLMRNNITRADLAAVIDYLNQADPILTHSKNVEAFEREWNEWLGVKHSVMVNSGSSANLLSLTALRELRGAGEVIVPPLTWVSDIAAVLQGGLTPVFVDINRRTLGMETQQVLARITDKTRAVFLTHILGYNALTQELVDGLAARNIPLIEDACESHGATFQGRKVGSFGWMSNFSFYYAHHLSTIEGGMISTDDAELHQVLRMLRSHGMVREADSETIRQAYREQYPDLNPQFIFAYPAYNVRPTEINAIIGRSQLRRLDDNNRIRTENLHLFLSNLDPAKYQTDFATEGSSNYAFTLVLQQPDDELWNAVSHALTRHGVEFRRGTSGGGNQLRQPYLRRLLGNEFEKYPNVNHIHFFGCYIGNYPCLEREKILQLCELLNRLPDGKK